jgi:predicted TIM-barrel fold metal-dependent hydrolase
MAEADVKEIENSAANHWTAEGSAPGGIIREVDYSRESKGLHPSFAGIKIVDTDTHIVEPPDLFTSRAPVGMKDKVPYVRRDENDIDRWFLGGRNCGTLGGNVVRRDNNKLLGRLSFPTLGEGHPGGHEVTPRLQAMDDMGIYAQICFPNSGITQPGMLITLNDNELSTTLLRIYNDFNVEWQQASGDRMFPMAHLPFWDKAALDAEARRCIDMGLRGFVLPNSPDMMGVPSFQDDYWTDFLELCDATGTPLNFHLNTGVNAEQLAWKDFSFEERISVVSLMSFVGNAATLGNWMISGRLDRHPGLKIGLIESGMGWIPFALETMEHQFRESLPNKVRMPKKRPREYFRDNFWCTFWFEEIGPRDMLEMIGVDKVMFETDFPHPTSLYPGIQEHLVRVLGGFDFEVKKKVLQDNAVKLYNLPF